MNIRVAKPSDFDEIYGMWKADRKLLGPPWKKTLSRHIEKGEFYLGYEDNVCVGMICLHYSKKYVRYEITALVVKAQYRRRGYGTKLIKYAVAQKQKMCNTGKLLGGPQLDILLSAIEGDANNIFYDRFCSIEWYNYYASCTTRIYKVLEDKLDAITDRVS